MNYLAIDYGTKNIGLAYSINDIIFTLPSIKNDDSTIANIDGIIAKYSIDKIYVGISEGKVADLTLQFVDRLRPMIKLTVETVEEAASTLEATDIYKQNKSKKKDYKKLVDSVAAAVILNRVISFN